MIPIPPSLGKQRCSTSCQTMLAEGLIDDFIPEVATKTFLQSTAETTAAAAGGLRTPQPKQAAARNKRKAAATGFAASAEFKRVKLVRSIEKNTAEQRRGVGSSGLGVKKGVTNRAGGQSLVVPAASAAPGVKAWGGRHPSDGGATAVLAAAAGEKSPHTPAAVGATAAAGATAGLKRQQQHAEGLTGGSGSKAVAGNARAAPKAVAAHAVRPSRGISAVAARGGLKPLNAGDNEEQGREGGGNRDQMEGEGGEVGGQPFDPTSSSVRLDQVVQQLRIAMGGRGVESGVEGGVGGPSSSALATRAAKGVGAVGPIGGIIDPLTAVEELTQAVVGRVAAAQQKTGSLEQELASSKALHDLDKQMLTAAKAQLREKQRRLLAAEERSAAEKAAAEAEDNIHRLQSQSQQLHGSLSAALAEKEEALKLAAAALEQKVKGLKEKQQGLVLQLQKAEADTSAAQQRAAAAETRAQQLQREKQELESQNAGALIKLQQLLDQVLAVV